MKIEEKTILQMFIDFIGKDADKIYEVRRDANWFILRKTTDKKPLNYENTQ